MLTKEDRFLLEKQAEVVKAIAHPLRIAILGFLKDAPQCVCDIAEHLGAERSNVSRHLSIMVKASVLEYEKQGLKVIYSLKTPCLIECFACITECLKQRAEDNQKLLKAL